MNAPVRGPEDGPSKDEPLYYAPKKARRPKSDTNPGAPAKGGSAASESAEPPWKRSKRRETFAGDAAIAARRNKLALTPDRLPAPPSHSTPKYVLVGRLAGVAVVTAVGVVGYQLGSSGPALFSPLALRPGLSDQEGGPERTVPAAGRLSTGTMADFAQDISSSAVANAAPVAYPPRSEEPALTSQATAIAIPPQSNPQRPRDAAPSQAASGGSGKSVPARATSQTRQHDASEIALMMKGGADLMAKGEVAAARMMYQRAAESGEALAAFALAETYDPLVLEKLNAKGGIAPDLALAHRWYERARDLGSAIAPERLDRLATLHE